MADQDNVTPTPDTEPAVDPAQRRVRLIFWALIGIGVLLRLVLLGRASYQIDEVNVVRDAVGLDSFRAIFESELERFTWYHRLPLLMVVIRASAKLVGFTGSFPPEWVARLPFALMGIGTLPLFYLLGKSLKDKTLGLWCMFLATFSVYFTYYSREAYDYGMVIFFVTGVLWSSIELIKWAGQEDAKPPWVAMVVYIISSAGLLQSHLSGLLFLGPWNVLMFFGIGITYGWDRIFKGNRPFIWLGTIGAAYVVFIPFLLKLFGGFTTTEHPMAKRFSLEVFPTLLGRMGWGQALPTLLPFVAFFIGGLVIALRSKDKEKRLLYVLLALGLASYFAVQSWMLRVSRFEVRYYSSLFPFVILFAAIGIEGAVQWLAAKKPKLRPPMLRGAVVVPLVLWLSVSLWAVLTLDCRGYNYKGIANWINTNVPNNGIYAFYNVYELRGVPSVYPTPGRFGTSAAAWSSGEDYKRVNPPQRVVSFFSRFPLAYFVEIAPDDLLAPETGVDPIPREPLFSQSLWLGDPSWERLMSLGTSPPGDTQPNAKNAHRVLISYNKAGDLPMLASKTGRRFFHYFGPDWQYYRDQQMNDFRVATQYGTIFAGNASNQDVDAKVTLHCIAPPRGGLVSIFGSDGQKLVDKQPVPANFAQVVVDRVKLRPGATALMVEVLPPPNEMEAALLVYAVSVEDAKPQPVAEEAQSN